MTAAAPPAGDCLGLAALPISGRRTGSRPQPRSQPARPHRSAAPPWRERGAPGLTAAARPRGGRALDPTAPPRDVTRPTRARQTPPAGGGEADGGVPAPCFSHDLSEQTHGDARRGGRPARARRPRLGAAGPGPSPRARLSCGAAPSRHRARAIP
jgi:hypothetical protein